MKYLYTLFALFITLNLSAQTSPITFDEAWTVNGADWTIKEDEGSNVSIETAADGNKYLQVVYNDAGQDWQNAQIKFTNAMGQNYFTLGPGKSITFDVWTDHTGDANIGTYTGMLKVEGGINGAPIKEFSFPVSGTGWESVTIDLSVDKGGNAVDAGEYELIVLFSNYGNGAHKKSDTRYFDNLTYTDGAVIPGDPSPATAAPTPTHNAADVLNVFSDHYANSLDWSVNEIRAGWSNGGETAVIDFAADDKMVKQKSANYIGSYWNGGGTAPNGAIDFSGHTNINLDVWVPELAADATLGFALLAANEVKVDYTIAAGAAGWRTLTIPVADFAASAINSVDGIKLEPNPQGSISIFYWDNLFAWSAPSNNTVASFSVDANNAGALFDSAGGEVLAISYSTDGGNTYTISNPLTDGDSDGIWTGDVTVAKDGSTVQYKLVTTDATSGYTTANDSSGDTLAADADFSYTADVNSVTQELVVLDRDAGSSFATTKASAVVNVTVIINGHHPDHSDGQYGVRSVGGGCYSLGDWTSHTDGVFSDFMTVPFYSTTTYNVGYHHNANGWCGDNYVSKDATTNADFSVTVVEDAVTEDLTALSAVDANGNYLVYTSTLSINDVNVELIMYPNPADQFISVKSSEVLSGIRVIDMTGKEVIRKSIKSNDYSLDIGNLNTGIYFLEATSNGASKTMRFIKK
tara:strand:- start:367 stop:2442 length:2076 start_codon:yes stop_codon:yes gene_type:complete